MFELRGVTLLIGLIIHILLSVNGTIILWNSIRFTKNQKQVNTVILWLFPFVWYILIKGMIKRTPGSHEIKKKDDTTNNPFHESGKGSPIANIRN